MTQSHILSIFKFSSLKISYDLRDSEISNFNKEAVLKFKEKFPCPNPKIDFNILGKSYLKLSNTGKYLTDEKDYFYEINLPGESINELMNRWNKYKKLLMFF